MSTSAKVRFRKDKATHCTASFVITLLSKHQAILQYYQFCFFSVLDNQWPHSLPWECTGLSQVSVDDKRPLLTDSLSYRWSCRITLALCSKYIQSDIYQNLARQQKFSSSQKLRGMNVWNRVSNVLLELLFLLCSFPIPWTFFWINIRG